MKFHMRWLVGLLVAASLPGLLWAADRGGGWDKRTPVTPDPSKVVVPDGYSVDVFKAGLDTPAAAAVDPDGNLWVTISGNWFGSLDEIEKPHIKVYDRNGRLLKEIGKGKFKTFLNEIEYCAENDTIYLSEYGERFWAIDGLDGELRVIIKDMHMGDHRNGGITCKDGYLYFALGWPSNTGFADPDNHGWTDIPSDPYWVRHDDGLPNRPHGAPCRRIVHTGLNMESSDGRMSGGMLPVGVAAEPGQVIEPQQPCHGSIQRVRLGDTNSQGLYPHSSMETYAYGFRNQSGVAFGPEGTRFEDALAVSDNGANDLGNRRVANGSEKLWLVTEQGQDAGFPDKEGFHFVSNKRFGWKTYTGSPVQRPYPNLYIGDEPFVPEMPPYRFESHIDGVRGVPLIIANPNPDGYINPVLEWDANNPIDGIAWSAGNFGADNDLFGAVYGNLDAGPESLIPTWPVVVRVEFLDPGGVKWYNFARNIEMGPNAYQEPENKGGLERPNDVVFSNDGRTMYVVDYGEVFVDARMPTPFYTVAGSGVIWTITRR